MSTRAPGVTGRTRPRSDVATVAGESLTRGATETRIGAPKSFDGVESRYSVETSGLTVATTAPPAPGLRRATGCQDAPTTRAARA